MKIRITAATLLLSLAWAAPAAAADPQLPEWEKLEPAQRATLVAPMRERWDSDPGARAEMLERAERWRQLSPEQRRNAHRGMDRWKHMNPEQREEARAFYSHMRTLTPEARGELKREWKQMDADQRRKWVQAHPAPARGD
ncbi:DUF3106 domain-containing protein [Lysobacter sp. GX 14042]|uniref:DUF3106 domain-containing protein n=1 Tax=Lysobacter sp. GX 14042 TaxID=2907155 RepID=UPI001F278605|nr:DUF3106 domain-containing protein [Lysobacter sp. GX 14042]MCE7031061.1 DUF3106 domain-containing protein [Lysobacter sp. GX 14042]